MLPRMDIRIPNYAHTVLPLRTYCNPCYRRKCSSYHTKYFAYRKEILHFPEGIVNCVRDGGNQLGFKNMLGKAALGSIADGFFHFEQCLVLDSEGKGEFFHNVQRRSSLPHLNLGDIGRGNARFFRQKLLTPAQLLAERLYVFPYYVLNRNLVHLQKNIANS